MKIPFLLFKNFIALAIFIQVAQSQEHAEIIMSATPVIKKTLKMFDEKVVDSAIITTCATYGATTGSYLSIQGMKLLSGRNYFNASERYEDDLGMYLGMVLGYHTGHFIVQLRHKITDPLFPQLFNFGAAGLNAGKTLCQNMAEGISSYFCYKLQQGTNFLTNYTQKKAN